MTAQESDGPSRSPVVTVLVAAIRLYREAVSPLRPARCRFTPSCSGYAMDALETHGLVRGMILAVRRLLRCHPWHRGGHDPVPPRVDRAVPHQTRNVPVIAVDAA